MRWEMVLQTPLQHPAPEILEWCGPQVRPVFACDIPHVLTCAFLHFRPRFQCSPLPLLEGFVRLGGAPHSRQGPLRDWRRPHPQQDNSAPHLEQDPVRLGGALTRSRVPTCGLVGAPHLQCRTTRDLAVVFTHSRCEFFNVCALGGTWFYCSRVEMRLPCRHSELSSRLLKGKFLFFFDSIRFMNLMNRQVVSPWQQDHSDSASDDGVFDREFPLYSLPLASLRRILHLCLFLCITEDSAESC